MFYVLFLLIPLCCNAIVIEQQKKIPASDHYSYEFFDLGKTDIPLEQLSTYALPNTLAPLLNDQRQAVCNTLEKGFIKDLKSGEISPQISTLTSHCHGINNNGDLLLSFQRYRPTDIEWWIWTQKNLRKDKMEKIDLMDVRGDNVYLRKMNDAKMAVGNLRPSGQLRPMLWTPQDGLHHLGYYLGWDIIGTAWGINNQGTVVGNVTEESENPPYAWNKKWGLEILRNFKNRWEAATQKKVGGRIHFADLVAGENNLIYGTFWIEEPDETGKKYLAFWWDPQGTEIRPLGIEGMRINGISHDNTLIGSYEGKAALCDPGNKPVLLQSLIKDMPSSWELLEASDINRLGDIIGYGRLNGKTHYFLIQRQK